MERQTLEVQHITNSNPQRSCNYQLLLYNLGKIFDNLEFDMTGFKSKVIFSPKRRIIWFSGEITARTADKAISALRKLNRTEGPVYFYLSGPGGDFKHCCRLGREIKNSLNPVVGIAHGELMSACFVLTQFFRACVGVRGSIFGFHRSVLETTRAIPKNMLLTQDDLRREWNRLMLMDAIQATIFYERIGDFDLIFELLRSEKVLSLNEAIELKLIDGHFDKYKEFLSDKRRILAISRKNRKKRF